MIQSNNGSTRCNRSLQLAIAHQFRRIFNSRAAGNEKQIFHRTALHDRKLIVLSLQVVGETGTRGGAQHQVQTRARAGRHR